jgi:hypothetical protein
VDKLKCVLCGVDPEVEQAIRVAGDTLEDARVQRREHDMGVELEVLPYEQVYDEVPNRFTWQDAKVLVRLLEDPDRLRDDLKAFIHNSTRDD